MLTWNAPVQAGQYPTLLPIGGSATAANASMSATLAPTSGKMTYISGFDLTSGSTTVGATKIVQVQGVVGGPLYYDVNPMSTDTTFAAGTLANAGQLSVRFAEPIPASNSTTTINVVVPALGAGNVQAAVTAYGFTCPLALGQT
jgi:hypothetical protein